MKTSKLLTLFLIVCILCGCNNKQDNQKVVLAYVPYYNSALPNPHLCTHINYAFAKVHCYDGVYDSFKLQGTEERFLSVLALKQQNPDLKICLSFGNFAEPDEPQPFAGFSVMCQNADNRKKFCKDCLAFVEKWGIDGIDLDWEFPGVSFHGREMYDREHDVENYTTLMKELRETLGDKYLLTYAGCIHQAKTREDGGRTHIDNIGCEPYVDFINIMTYDMGTAPYPHNAIVSDNEQDWEHALTSYLEAGYPMNKIVMGVPFYGRHSWSDGEWYYHRLLKIQEEQPEEWEINNWDSIGCVPYATHNGEFWCSYDNPQSIAIKADWIKKNGMRGLMYWEVSGDDEYETLQHALYDNIIRD